MNYNNFDCSQPYLPQEVNNSINSKNFYNKNNCNNQLPYLLQKYNKINKTLNKIQNIKTPLANLFKIDNIFVNTLQHTHSPSISNILSPASIPSPSILDILSPANIPSPSISNILSPASIPSPSILDILSPASIPSPSISDILSKLPISTPSSTPCTYTPWSTLSTPITGCKTGYQYQTRASIDGGKGDCNEPIIKTIPVSVPANITQCAPCVYGNWQTTNTAVTGCKLGTLMQSRSVTNNDRGDCTATSQTLTNQPISDITQCAPCDYGPWQTINTTVTGCKTGIQTQMRNAFNRGKNDCIEPTVQNILTSLNDTSLCSPCVYTSWYDVDNPIVIGCKVGKQIQSRIAYDLGKGDCNEPIYQEIYVPINDTSLCAPCTLGEWVSFSTTLTGCKTADLLQKRTLQDNGKDDCYNIPSTQLLQNISTTDTSLCPCDTTNYTDYTYTDSNCSESCGNGFITRTWTKTPSTNCLGLQTITQQFTCNGNCNFKAPTASLVGNVVINNIKYVVFAFMNPGTHTINYSSNECNVQVLAVGGGGSGGGHLGGGGGGGGVVMKSFTLPNSNGESTITINVADKHTSGSDPGTYVYASYNDGYPTTIKFNNNDSLNITALGGGGGAYNWTAGGNTGASNGGNGSRNLLQQIINTISITYNNYANKGGIPELTEGCGGGGGGGAGTQGGNGKNNNIGGNGGDGIKINETIIPAIGNFQPSGYSAFKDYYWGGGGGGANLHNYNTRYGNGGKGGGGGGANGFTMPGGAGGIGGIRSGGNARQASATVVELPGDGAANTGGGGGGYINNNANSYGGSGIVVIAFQYS